MEELETTELGLRSYTTYATLFGHAMPHDQIVEMIRNNALDMIVGGLEALWRYADRAPDPLQAERESLKFLLGIAPLRRYRERLELVITDAGPVFHPHAAAYLTHLALLHAQRDVVTPELGDLHFAKVLSLLLMVSDHLTGETSLRTAEPGVVPVNLQTRKAFVMDLMRQMQFQPLPDRHAVRRRVDRYARIYGDELQRVGLPFDPEEVFFQTKGITLAQYFATLSLLLTWLQHDDGTPAKGAVWFTKETLLQAVMSEHRVAAEVTLWMWTITPAEYEAQYRAWVENRKGTYLPTFDFVILRSRPILEVRPGELLVPVMQFLGEVATTGPHFAILDALPTSQKAAFWQGTGDAFERYAERLLTTLASSDQRGAWALRTDVKVRSGRQEAELSDGYLQRDGVAVTFELKALRFPNDFLGGLSNRTVLGPDDDLLAELDGGTAVTAEDVKRRKADKGLVTRGMYQQSLAGPALREYALKELGEAPQVVYPVLVHLADYRVVPLMYNLYLRPVMHRLGLYADGYWRPPQWMHIDDLEMLAGSAEAGSLDLAAFLASKPPEKRMDQALFEQLVGKLWKQSLTVRENTERMNMWVQAMFQVPSGRPDEAAEDA